MIGLVDCKKDPTWIGSNGPILPTTLKPFWKGRWLGHNGNSSRLFCEGQGTAGRMRYAAQPASFFKRSS